jgi:hypothetical protein
MDRGLRHSQSAVSPRDEATWPADEFFVTNGKLLALQFKRPSFRVGGPPYWRLGEPAHQFPQVRAHDEIYYAFPLFSDRRAPDMVESDLK